MFPSGLFPPSLFPAGLFPGTGVTVTPPSSGGAPPITNFALDFRFAWNFSLDF